MSRLVGVLIFFAYIAGCDTFYKAVVKNESDIPITFVGRNNPKNGSTILPNSGRAIGWNDVCQVVFIEGEKIYLDTSSAPYESLTIGRTTPGVFSISFDGKDFFFITTPKEKIKIRQLYSCD